jgi:GAF domain-containing protein
MSAEIASTETKRLKVLWQYEVLDTVPEALFDDLTELAAGICEAPIALISLVDENRQWFKSKFGTTVTETSRDISFCAHAIQQSDLFIVPDATKDERFANNPLVISDPKIRFYAGAPLLTPDGYALGTLCVIDKVPRELRPDQKQALRILARHIVSQLELRRRSLQSQKELTSATRGKARKAPGEPTRIKPRPVRKRPVVARRRHSSAKPARKQTSGRASRASGNGRNR